MSKKNTPLRDDSIARLGRTADVVSRAQAARPILRGEDRLDFMEQAGARQHPSGRYGFPGN